MHIKFAFGVILWIFYALKESDSQWTQDDFYTPMVFDQKVRQGFNNTECLNTMLNCVESTRGAMVCTLKYHNSPKSEYDYYYAKTLDWYHGSICDFMWIYCDDIMGRGPWNYRFHDMYVKRDDKNCSVFPMWDFPRAPVGHNHIGVKAQERHW